MIPSGKPIASAVSERRATSRRRSTSRHAEAGERAELGPDDHRADDQDRRAEEDPDRGDQAGEHHEGEEVAAESSMLSEVRASTSSQTTASAGEPAGGPLGAVAPRSEICESICSSEIEPLAGDPELLQVVDDHAGFLAGDVAEDHVAGRLARRAREDDRLQVEPRRLEQVEDPARSAPPGRRSAGGPCSLRVSPARRHLVSVRC